TPPARPQSPTLSLHDALPISGTLSEGRIAAVIGQLARHEIGETIEAKLGRLEEFVVQIHATAFKSAPEVEILSPHNPANVIAPGEIVADEGSRRIVAEIEAVVDPDLLDRFYGLEGKVNP